MAEGSHTPGLRLTALRLQRFLGLQRADQALHFGAGELAAGVTLIAGPNGSGKTTLARAIEGLLWPESVPDPRAEVHASVELAGEAWSVELLGTTAHWRHAGTPAAGPSYCPASDRDRYRLSLHELLTADDGVLAAGIRRELGGGYSLSEAGAQLGFTAHPPVSRKALQSLRQAEEAVAQATREQSGLRRSEADLVRLRAQEAEARQAVTQLETVTRLLRWREAGRALVLARQQAALYDARVVALRGKELEHFRELQRHAVQAQEAANRAAAELERLEEALSAGRPSHPLATPESLRRSRALALQLQQAENELRKAQIDLAGSRAQEATARRALAPRLSAEQLALLDRLQPDASLAEAVQTAAAASVAGGVLDCFTALPLWTEPVSDAATLETQRRGLDLLLAWLREPAPAAPVEGNADATRWPRWLALAGTVLCLLLAVTVDRGLALAAVLLGVLVWLLRPRPKPAAPVSRRADHADAFVRLGLPPPAAWDEVEVSRCLDRLALTWSLGSGHREVLGQARAARTVLEQQATERQRALEECLGRNGSRLGVTLETSPLAVFHLVTRIAAWQAARDEESRAEQACAAAQQHVGVLLARLRGELGESAAAALEDSAAALAVTEALEKELAAVATAEKNRDEQARRVAQEQRSATEYAERRRALLDGVGIRPDEVHDAEGLLARWTSQRTAATAAVQAVQAATAQVSQCRAEAHRAGPAGRELQSLRTPDLQRTREDLERVALRRDQLLREMESTETLVREAKRKHDLEQHLAAREAALVDLRREREAGWRALAGQGCLELLASRLETQTSGVLRRAQALFAQITRGRYRLLAEEAQAGAVFRARDCETDRVLDLEALSSGTRVQLLLAARLAFIAEKEGDGPRLPLLLDEVLGNSDDERAGTIVDVVIEAARTGRQVFCFTAQHDEVTKWQTRLAQAGVPHALCWLPRTTVPPPQVSLAPVAAPEVPRAQAGESALAYAQRLGVPALDSFDTDAGSLHLWYLIEDPGVLHALMQAGYRTWGQLGALLRAGGGHVVPADGVAGPLRLNPRRLEAKVELIVLLLSLLRIGRGRPLGRAGLAASGLVTERYFEDVGRVLEHVGGDAALLVERLTQGDVKGFRNRNAEALSAWLSEQGYIDRRVALSRDDIRARVHGTAAPYLADGTLSMDDVRGILRLAAPAGSL